MKKSRYIPYGYTVQNGITIVDRKEATVVKEIFEQYINGASLKDIAESLTGRQVPYTEKKTEWNKGRIARIIENARYTGVADYEPIIDEDIYNHAVNCKIARQQTVVDTTNSAIPLIRNRIKCGKCGWNMVRKVSSKYRIRESWFCTNPECGCKVRMTDNNLIAKITFLLNRIIENAELMTPPAPIENQSESPTLFKLNNELREELAQEHPSEDSILRIIRRMALERYTEVNALPNIQAQIAKQRIRLLTAKDTFDEESFQSIVEYIEMNEDATIRIHTKTETIITEDDHGSQENPETGCDTD